MLSSQIITYHLYIIGCYCANKLLYCPETDLNTSKSYEDGGPWHNFVVKKSHRVTEYNCV